MTDRRDAPLRIPATAVRRAGFFTLATMTTLTGVWLMLDILRANGMSPLEMAILVLFAITFGWISLAFWSAAAGFVLQAMGIDPLSLRRGSAHGHYTAPTALRTRTAVVMPVHNEDVQRVIAGLEATYNDLQSTGERDTFDFYLLSDSTDSEIATAEAAAIKRLRSRVWGSGNIYYRLRRTNEGRKAGNIAEFCRRWGARYENMIVLDADSVMTGSAMVTLARAMQANPHAGMIQTVPIPVRQETFFGRFVQFAATLYSPMLATGLAFWQTDTANYWGHNAIIRIAPFMAHCGLPRLGGKPPFGGEILSHDFVEAALMRRGGWHVYLFPELEGSYEEVPGNLLDFAKRDRRWAQGNLQHMKLLLTRDLHPLSRLHFLMGALAYLCSLLWLLMLLVSTVDAVSRALTVERYFGAAYQLFPDWPIAKTGEMIWLLAVVAALLLLPKLMGVVLATLDRKRRAAFGGSGALVASTFVETLFSVL
ncbi:MAG TPA: glucans biosynthesis glucosyltransferase MdoH, partial [Gammaproteobacteria bacterium]|nr:glucans biosynthesis glucosyltransferase MdoH [Gammaproteobacteria bacterium]